MRNASFEMFCGDLRLSTAFVCARSHWQLTNRQQNPAQRQRKMLCWARPSGLALGWCVLYYSISVSHIIDCCLSALSSTNHITQFPRGPRTCRADNNIWYLISNLRSTIRSASEIQRYPPCHSVSRKRATGSLRKLTTPVRRKCSLKREHAHYFLSIYATRHAMCTNIWYAKKK